MKAIQTLKTKVADLYIVAIISLLGAFAFVSAVLIAWPALAYIGSKVF